MNYTVGRLVQGLASTRECARHGYYVTLVGILKSIGTEQLSNQFLYDAIKNRLEIEGTKKVNHCTIILSINKMAINICISKQERVDQHVGQVLAYGSLVKSGRLSGNEEIISVVKQMLASSKMKSYIHPIAFGFLEELCKQVSLLFHF